MELGKVIVDRNNVHALAGECVEVCGQGCGQGFTFTGAHLRNAALMQYDTAQKLHRERTHADRSHRAFARHGKCLRQNGVQAFAACNALFELLGLTTQFVIRHFLIFRLKRLDRIHDLAQFLDLFIVRSSQ